MSILNEIESTAEEVLQPGELILTEVEADVANISKGVTEIESSAESLIAEPAHIIKEAHAFFDLAKSKIEEVIDHVMQHASSTEEAIEAAILTAFGHASNQVNGVVTEVSSS